MNDMSSVIVAKSDQWNADDFTAGPRVFTIEDVAIRPGTEQPVSIKLAGSDKVFRPCKTVSRVLVAAWGADANEYRGRLIELYTDPAVTWGGMKVGGIRISRMSHLDKALVIALQEKKGSRKMTTVQPLKVEAPEQFTLEAAELSLRTAATMDELSTAWRAKRMQPFREKLQSVLDERKTALSAPTSERTSTDELLDMFANAKSQEDVTNATKAANVLGVDQADYEDARNAALERVA